MLHRTLTAFTTRSVSLSTFLSLNGGHEPQNAEPVQGASDWARLHLGNIVLKSNSPRIEENLTMEEALLRGVTIPNDRTILFIYCDSPCVVVGRNQNIYQEVSVRRACCEQVTIMRRSSGGGAVFHDQGNVCFSFLTSRASYAPEKTIQILRFALCQAFGIEPARLTITKRCDLFLDGYKITGSAMRVQQGMSFHHCTLLVNSDLERVGRYLHPEGNYLSFSTTSVSSVRSAVTTLSAKGVGAGMLSRRDGVQLVEDAVSDFFLSCGQEMIHHKAPWELQPGEIKAELCSTKERRYGVIDTRGATLRDEPLSNAHGYRPVPGDCTSFRSETSRISSGDWIFSMPTFATEVAITAEAYQSVLKEDRLWSSLLYPKLALFKISEEAMLEGLCSMVFGESAAPSELRDTHGVWSLVLHTVVLHRMITAVRVRRVFPPALMEARQGAPSSKAVFFPDLLPGHGGGEQDKENKELSEHAVSSIPWLERFLQTVLTGTACDTKLAALEADALRDEEVRILLQGLHLELALAPEQAVLGTFPEDILDLLLLLIVRAILRCWREENIFDISFTTKLPIKYASP